VAVVPGAAGEPRHKIISAAARARLPIKDETRTRFAFTWRSKYYFAALLVPG
jgi:hypothetical protein